MAYRHFPLLTDDIDEEDLTPGSKEFRRQNIEQNIAPYFDEDVRPKPEERNVYTRLTEEERKEVERELAEGAIAEMCRCLPSDFLDPDPGVRMTKATMVNLYFEYGGNWGKVFKDRRSASRRAMAVYWRDEIFRAHIAALDPILMLEARGVVVEVWKDGLDEKARLAAALRYLEQADAYNWDRGVRKQVVANKGSLQSALFTRVISDEEFLNAYVKDKLNKLPENVRSALEETLSQKPQEATELPKSAGIQVADMTKLKDPFGEYEDGITDSDEEVQTDSADD